MAVGRRKKTKPVNVPVPLLDRVDEIKDSESSSYVSRDEFVRSAVRRLVEEEERRLARMAPVCDECDEVMPELMELSADPREGPTNLNIEKPVRCPSCGAPNELDDETEFRRVTQRDRDRI